MKCVFIEMDGVIAEYGYSVATHNGDLQDKKYSDKKPVNIIMDEIIKKYNNEEHILIVCSTSPNSKVTLEKNEWLNKHFNIPYENRLFINSEEEKVDVIKYYVEDIMRGDSKTQCIIIDDKGEILAKAHSLGIECYHPTQILASIVNEQSPEEHTGSKEADDATSASEENSEGEQMTFDDLKELSESEIDAPIEVEEVKEEK